MQICLYGASSNVLAQSYLDAAYDAGRLLAQRGHALVYGGGARRARKRRQSHRRRPVVF